MVYDRELYADTGRKEKALKNLKKAETMYKAMERDYKVIWGRTKLIYCICKRNIPEKGVFKA